MSVAEQLGRVAREGWDAFDEKALIEAEKKDLAAAREDMRREAAIVGVVLDNPAGNAFVEWLIGKTNMLPPDGELSSAKSAQMYAIAAAEWRGRIQVVTMIRAALVVARDKSEPPT